MDTIHLSDYTSVINGLFDDEKVEPPLGSIEILDNEVYKDYIPFINKKRNIYACFCGQKGVFEPYFNHNIFVCPNCGNKYFIKTGAKHKFKIDLNRMYEIINWQTTILRGGTYEKQPLFVDDSINSQITLLKDKEDDEFYYFKCKEFNIEVDSELATSLTTSYKGYKLRKNTFELYDMKGKERSKFLSYDEMYETCKILRDYLYSKLEYTIENANVHISPYHSNDYITLLQILSSNAVYQLHSSGLIKHITSMDGSKTVSKWDLTKTNLSEILKLPKTLCNLLNECERNNHLFTKDRVLRCIYNLYDKHSDKRIKFNLGQTRNIILASFEILERWYDTVQRETLKQTENIANQYRIPTDEVNINLIGMQYKFNVSYYDLELVVERLSKLVSYGYNIPRTIEYVSGCYEKQGITLTEFLVQLEDYARMSKSMRLKYEKYPMSVKLVHDLALKKYTLVHNSMKDDELQKIAEAYNKYEITVKGYSFIIPTKCLDFVRESNHLGHCVSSYTDKVFNGECVIVFMRNADNIDKPFITIEIDDNGTVKQVKGFSDKKPALEYLRIIKEWGKQVGLYYNCR